MGVSKNNGTPKSSSFNRVFHDFNHPFWGKTPSFWFNIHIQQITRGRGPMKNSKLGPLGNCKIFGSGFGSFFVSQPIQKLIHSLKLTFLAPENGWLEYFLVSFWDSIFSGAFTVSFRESTGWVQNISEFYEDYIIKVPYSKIVRIIFLLLPGFRQASRYRVNLRFHTNQFPVSQIPFLVSVPTLSIACLLFLFREQPPSTIFTPNHQ